jgi:hypothetical protein
MDFLKIIESRTSEFLKLTIIFINSLFLMNAHQKLFLGYQNLTKIVKKSKIGGKLNKADSQKRKM